MTKSQVSNKGARILGVDLRTNTAKRYARTPKAAYWGVDYEYLEKRRKELEELKIQSEIAAEEKTSELRDLITDRKSVV